jgi:hypothetical protein
MKLFEEAKQVDGVKICSSQTAMGSAQTVEELKALLPQE